MMLGIGQSIVGEGSRHWLSSRSQHDHHSWSACFCKRVAGEVNVEKIVVELRNLGRYCIGAEPLNEMETRSWSEPEVIKDLLRNGIGSYESANKRFHKVYAFAGFRKPGDYFPVRIDLQMIQRKGCRVPIRPTVMHPHSVG
jgi:hypothetical protein